jgi:hypothetical protein
MASSARSRLHSRPFPKTPPKASVLKAENELLSEVMDSVSKSLEKMSPEEREKAIKAAEKSVRHLQ